MFSSWEMFYFDREIFRGTVRNQGEHSRETGDSAHGGREERLGIETEGGEGRMRGGIGREGGWGKDGEAGRGRRKGGQNLWVCEYFTFTIYV